MYKRDFPGCGGFLLFFALLGLVVTFAIRSDNAKAERIRQECLSKLPAVLERWPDLFEKLDADGDGLLFEEELRNAKMEGGFTGKDKEVVDFLYAHCHDVGHVIGTYRSGKYTISVYAISKADLRILPQTAEKKWGK